MTYDFATRIKRIEAELMALKIAHGSGQGATVYDSEITLTQGGVTKGSFTVNQSSDETIALDAPNDGTLTIQKNGTDIQTFTANQSGNSTANITVPTTVAELSDASDYVKDTDLATVATTGDYDDLTNTPTIPTLKGSRIYYGVCSTPANAVSKVVTTVDGDFTLETGATVTVYFTYSNTIGVPTLSVDGSTPKEIRNIGDGSGIAHYYWRPFEAQTFTYNGTYWLADGGLAGTTYYGKTRLSSSVTSTSTSLSATPSAVKSAYDLANGKSTVSYSPTLTSGTTVGALTIDGVASTLYAPTPPTVSVSQTLTSGTEVGEITIDGTGTKLYAPTPAGAATSNYVWHGTCSTATATAAKVATLDDATGFTLADGVVISVTFANSNIDRSATLNVNSTGAKDIIDYTLSDTNTHDGAAIWQSGETVLFSYHSGEDAWERVGGAPTYLSEGGYWDFSVGDVLILSGVASANSSATTDVQVNFRKTFADPPRVFLTNNFNESGGSLWWAYTKSITTTGFTFRSGYTSITGTGGGGNSGSSISWLAIGRIAGAT